MFRFKHVAAAAILAVTFGSTSSLASPAIVSFTVGSQFTGFSSDETVGWSFRVAAGPGVSVTALGWWDAGGDDLAASHKVGIWDTAGNLLGSSTVNPGDPLIGGFRYAATASIVLMGGQTYIIGGQDLVNDGDNYSSSNGALTMDPQIAFLQSARSGNGLGFAFPNTLTANTGGRFGPNFMLDQVQGVPEPSTYGLAALGLLAAGAVVRRRRAT